MANSPFIISDNGSTGAGTSRQNPITPTNAVYYGTLQEIPTASVVWFKLTLPSGKWMFGTGTTESFTALYSSGGLLLWRGVGGSTSITLQAGIYFMALANKSSKAEDNFSFSAGSYGEVAAATPINVALSYEVPKIITPEWVKSLPNFKRAIFCPTPKENETPESIRITASGSIKSPTMLVDSGFLSRVFAINEQSYNAGGGIRRFVEDDEGEIAPALGTEGSRYKPMGAAFFSNTFSSTAAIRLNLNQTTINGIKAVIGLSFRRPFGSLTKGQASNCIIVELLNPQGQTIVTAKGGVGLEAFIKGSPNKVYNATATGKKYEESDKFSAPAFRALAIIVAPDGRVAVGTHHPDFITEFQDFKIYYNYICHHGGYPEIGQLSPADMVISAIRVTVSKTCGMTYADIHLPNTDAANLNEGGWWQDKHFAREDVFDLSSTLTENDWDRTPI